MILLDDVWERLDLQRVGVPSPTAQNKSKVILTTRSLNVCRCMEAQKSIKVECLTEEEAINLFKEKVGETTLNSHPDIPQLAEIAAKECKGLPLALATIGRAMAGKNTPQEWERAIQVLKTYPSKLSGMGDHVFPILKFSYDNLPNDTIKSCFLYLAIFPEDHEILSESLVLLWIGEGFFDERDNIYDAFNQGRDIIEHLKTACLFESYKYDRVKMHDVIRDMALWLATTYSGNQNKIFVEEKDNVEVHQVSKWKEVQRMYMLFSSMVESGMPPSFPNLVTLIVRSGGMETFPSGFFHFMPIIKVLNLSGTGITKLPIGIGKLVTLEYLNLSFTRLTELSTELKTLKKIRCLLLRGMSHLKMISKEVISNLSMMRIFVLEFNELILETENARQSPREEEEPRYSSEDNGALYLRKDNKALLEELEGLEHINWVNVTVEGALSFQKLSSSQKLKNVMRDLSLVNLEGMTLLRLPRMKHLRNLEILSCGELQEIEVDQEREGRQGFVADYFHIPNSNFCYLCRVDIFQLPKLLDLTWLIYIPSLEELRVEDCESMEEVIGDTGEVPENLGIFSRLKDLCLEDLPNLRSISRRALPFPSLTKLIVINCQNLKKLPLDSNSARNSLKEIVGELDWWEGLQWEDETIRLIFTPYHSTWE